MQRLMEKVHNTFFINNVSSLSDCQSFCNIVISIISEIITKVDTLRSNGILSSSVLAIVWWCDGLH